MELFCPAFSGWIGQRLRRRKAATYELRLSYWRVHAYNPSGLRLVTPTTTTTTGHIEKAAHPLPEQVKRWSRFSTIRDT